MEEGEPLLQKVMIDGQIIQPLPSLPEIRDRFQIEFGRLGDHYKLIRDPAVFPVQISPDLQALKKLFESRLAVPGPELAGPPPRDLGES